MDKSQETKFIKNTMAQTWEKFTILLIVYFVICSDVYIKMPKGLKTPKKEFKNSQICKVLATFTYKFFNQSC
jgi:hypothetical protein